MADEIRAFIRDHESELKARPEAVRPPDTSGLTAGATLAPMGGNVGTAFDAVRQRAFSPRGG